MELMAAFMQYTQKSRCHLYYQQQQEQACPEKELAKQQQPPPGQQEHLQQARSQEQPEHLQHYQAPLQEQLATHPCQQSQQDAGVQAQQSVLPVQCLPGFLQTLDLPGWGQGHAVYASQQIIWHTNVVEACRRATSPGAWQPSKATSSRPTVETGACNNVQREPHTGKSSLQGQDAIADTGIPPLQTNQPFSQAHQEQQQEGWKLQVGQSQQQQPLQEMQETQKGEDHHHHNQQQQQGQQDQPQQNTDRESPGWVPAAKEEAAAAGQAPGFLPGAGPQQLQDLIYAELAAAILAAAETEATAAAGKLPREAVQLLANLAGDMQQQQQDQRQLEQVLVVPANDHLQQQQQDQSQLNHSIRANSHLQQQQDQRQLEQLLPASHYLEQQQDQEQQGNVVPANHLLQHQQQQGEELQETRQGLAAAIWSLAQKLPEVQVPVCDVRAVAWVAALIQQQLAEAAVAALLAVAAAEDQELCLDDPAVAAPAPPLAAGESEGLTGALVKEQPSDQATNGIAAEPEVSQVRAARLEPVTRQDIIATSSSSPPSSSAAAAALPTLLSSSSSQSSMAVAEPAGAAGAPAICHGSKGGAPEDDQTADEAASAGGARWDEVLLAASTFTVEDGHLQQLLLQVGMACIEALHEEQQQQDIEDLQRKDLQQQQQQEEEEEDSNILLGPTAARPPAVALRPSWPFISLSLSMGSSNSASPKLTTESFYGKLLLRQSSGWSETQQLSYSPWAGARNGPFVSLTYPAVAVGVGDLLRISSRGDWPNSASCSSSPLVRSSQAAAATSAFQWGSGNLGASWSKGGAGGGGSPVCREGGGAGALLSVELPKVGVGVEASMKREGSMKRYGSGGSMLQLLDGSPRPRSTDWLIGSHFGSEES
jgi:hypothetical protein